ncbi:GCN5 family N-acetyltransferase [Streptomyces daqingensis]|uniref:GCN5 family N-acetyltransferase n=1 Tax=Streptomyces daqingensis TaxID=1472640 RepID=A0ABQ2LQG2_9ACTN|nr:GNAT family N-acetyltransferase [Streptomyces daqingensis]GGO41878.1 GCN5 family N-acetyltransferase [Streptomyces daqingensis]
MTAAISVRPGREEDLRDLQDIERAAGRVFRDLGMDLVADDAPPALAVLRRFRRGGGLWVAAAPPDDRPVAYALVEPVDGNAHIEQISVHPDHARQRIGQALIEHVAERAEAVGIPALTLSTFTRVPWNAPYYERLGFRALEPRELTPGLLRIREEETLAGLDRWPRVCMRRPLRAR